MAYTFTSTTLEAVEGGWISVKFEASLLYTESSSTVRATWLKNSALKTTEMKIKQSDRIPYPPEWPQTQRKTADFKPETSGKQNYW